MRVYQFRHLGTVLNHIVSWCDTLSTFTAKYSILYLDRAYI
jgi:hypothetical protein